ncbi:MAG: hypothetical protein IT559_02905 [Alphaproteobacteria bacterium]|nr:hypothetical protein [Alphaproteobacteria bacterium]
MSISKPALPSAITSYDLLKCFAVAIMITDHAGNYFFPDDLWWRAVGRIGFPVWFFLVGYARGRDIPLKLSVGAGILILANLLTGMAVFPLNALVTIALIRVTIDPVMKVLMRSRLILWSGSAFLFVLVIPTFIFTEYGTQALITAIFGYLVRHREEVKDEQLIIQYMCFALITFIILQFLTFGFTPAQMIFMGIGTAAVRSLLYYFSPKTYPALTEKLPKSVVWFVQICGRRTLEIYVVHLLLFKAMAVYLGMEGYNFLDWSWL